MTKMKVGALSAAAQAALEPHVGRVYASPGSTFLCIAEYEHVERTQPGPRSDKEAQVTVVPTSLEVAVGEHAHPIREAMRALYTLRTATGTLDEDSGQIELSENTIRQTAGMISEVRAAELVATCKQWAHYVRSVRAQEKPTVEGLLRELDRIATGLYAAVSGSDEEKATAPEAPAMPAQKRAAKKAPATVKA